MKIVLDRPGATPTEREDRAKLVSTAANLVPLIAANAERTESERRVVEENITALRDAGLLSLALPKRYGGAQCDIRTLMEVSAELARGCGATSWVATLINVCNWFAALFPEQAQHELWAADPNTRVAGSLTPDGLATPVEGGYRVTGKWAWASGSAHAQWAIIAVPVAASAQPSDNQPSDNQPPQVELMLVPMRELSIQDTWFMAGMAGTASNTLVGTEVFVPSHRCVLMSRLFDGDYPTPLRDEALYRAAFVPVALLILAGPQLGLARAALDLVLDTAPKRALSGTVYPHQSDAPGVQLDVAEAALLVESAYLHVYSAAAEIDQWAYDGVQPDYLARTKIRMNTGAAVRYAREAIRMLVSVHGASSFATANRLQRIWRDSETGSRHTAIRQDVNAELYGKALLGLPDRVSPLV